MMSETWDFRTGRRIGGAEALEQTIYLTLRTERYRYPIYGQDYGVELEDLFAQPPGFVRTELTRRVREALLRDDRILSADAFRFERTGKNTLSCSVTVRTIYGESVGERTVPV